MQNSIFEQGSVVKTYFHFSLPVVFSLVITIIYNVADTYFIAQAQNTALVAAVSLCAPVFTTLMAFGNIFGQGGSSQLSRLLGQNETESIRRVSSFCFYVAVLFGVAAGVLMLLFRTPLLALLGADAATVGFAGDYYTVLALGAPAVVLSFIHSNLLRSEGMARESMVGTVGGAVLNIILDPLLITGLNMGAAGAAIATVLGYLFSDGYFIFIVLKKSRILSINPREVKISAGHVGQIFAIGTSAALANLMQSVCMVVTNQFLLPYGNDKIAAMGIVLKVGMIVMLVLTGFSFGGAPMIGYYYGSANHVRLNQLLKFAFTFLCGLAAVLELALMAAAPLAIRCFLHDEAIVQEGVLMLRLQMVTMVCVAVVLLITVLFQATGHAGEALLLSISRQGVVFLAVLLVAVQVGGYYGILAAQPIADGISTVLAVGLYANRFKNRPAK